MAAEQLSAMTGMSSVEAANFLEMTGGDIESAIGLYFDMQGGGGGGFEDAPGDAGGYHATAATPEVHKVVFGGEQAPPAWLEQGFEFSKDAASTCCLLQNKNGPCGVLAAINAVMVAQLGCPLPSAPLADPEIALSSTLATVLVRCATAGEGDASAKVIVASWADGNVGGAIVEAEVQANEAAVAEHLHTCIATFTSPGGVNLFCYSAVLTRGLDRTSREVGFDGGSCPLVVGPHALCTTELMSLFMCGIARGNVGAYGDDAEKVTWRSKMEVGLISREEADMDRPLADELKGPSKPVYVIHGGDHFTIMWVPSSQSPPDGGVDFVHWNALPPNRALVPLRLKRCSLDPPPPAPAKHKPTHWKMQIGELESVVQADPSDKKEHPGCWRAHRYELALVTQAVVDEDASEARPADVPAPTTYEQGSPPVEGERWRCAACYQTRFKTMCFGENNTPASRECKFCGRAQAEVGWTTWKRYDELPPAGKRRVDRLSGPKILSVLRTRWPEAELFLFNSAGGEVPVGGGEFTTGNHTLPVA